MPRNTITYTQSRIGYAILSTGSSCHGQTRPHACVHTKPLVAHPTYKPTRDNQFRPIDTAGPACIQSQTFKTQQVVRPRAVKSQRSITTIPGRAYRVQTSATYIPESYSKYAYIRKDIRSTESAHYNSTIHVPDTFEPISTFTFPVDHQVTTDTVGTTASTSNTRPTAEMIEKQTDRLNVDNQNRSVRKAEIKRLTKIIKTGDLNAVQHWTRAVRRWTNEVETELHAINHGTKIFESLIGQLSKKQ